MYVDFMEQIEHQSKHLSTALATESSHKLSDSQEEFVDVNLGANVCVDVCGTCTVTFIHIQVPLGSDYHKPPPHQHPMPTLCPQPRSIGIQYARLKPSIIRMESQECIHLSRKHWHRL